MSHDDSVKSVMDGKIVMKSKGLSSIEYHGDLILLDRYQILSHVDSIRSVDH